MPIWVLTALTLVVVLAGVGIAWRQYAGKEIPVTVPVGNRHRRWLGT